MYASGNTEATARHLSTSGARIHSKIWVTASAPRMSSLTDPAGLAAEMLLERAAIQQVRERIGTAADVLKMTYRTGWSDGGAIPTSVRVTSVEQRAENGRERWKVSYERVVPRPPHLEEHTGWMIVAPDRNWTIQEDELVRRLPGGGERLRQQVVQGPAVGEALPIDIGQRLKLGVGHNHPRPRLGKHTFKLSSAASRIDGKKHRPQPHRG
jgi:hypothetical protein